MTGVHHHARDANRRVRMAVAYGAGAVALALAGCGGSSSAGLSTSQLAARADAACTAFNTGASKIQTPADLPRNPATAATYFDALKPLGDAFDRTMRSLKPNSTAKPLWDRFVAAGQHIGVLTDEADAKAHANDRSALIAISQTVSHYQQTTLSPLANRLGATDCA